MRIHFYMQSICDGNSRLIAIAAAVRTVERSSGSRYQVSTGHCERHSLGVFKG